MSRMLKRASVVLASTLAIGVLTPVARVEGQVMGGPSGQVVPSSHMVPGAASIQGQTMIGIGGDASGCSTCGANGYPKVPGYPAPPQVGLATGVCQPCIRAVDCADDCLRENRWSDARLIDFQPLAHGEFMGPIRIPAMLEQRIRSGDELRFTFVNSRQQLAPDYRLQVGDQIKISSYTDEKLRMGDSLNGVEVQADGYIHVAMIGKVRVAGLTIPQIRQELEKSYKKYLKDPSIDVEPVKTNSLLRDLQNSVNSQFAGGGLSQVVTVNADGRINLPLVGGVYVYGLTLDEIRREVNLRYVERNALGLEVEPSISRSAPRFVYVSGEVNKPGRYELTGPTSATQALALAEGIKNGGNHRQIVIMRRAEDWRLLATKLDLQGAHLGRRPDPSDEIWMRADDIIHVPPTPIKQFDNFLEQYLTNGLYRIVPFQGITIQQN